MTTENAQMLREPILTLEDIGAINAARAVLEAAEKRAQAAGLGLLVSPPARITSTAADAMDFGRFIEAAHAARDGLFHALNVASSYRVADVPEALMHMREEEAAEAPEMLRDDALVEPPAIEQSGPQPDELRAQVYVGDEPGPDLSDATEHDWRL